MNVLMYPIAPEDDFPDEFCAIRQGSGEHWFYTPVGEDASWMLFRAESENAKLRELVRDLWKACPADGYYCIYHCEHYDKESESHCKLEDRMRELGWRWTGERDRDFAPTAGRARGGVGQRPK